MTDNSLQLLQNITAPFAFTSEDVQGPGGNTSIKQGGNLLIKASGFTFKDVAHSMGVVELNNQAIIDNLSTKVAHADSILENEPPQVLYSLPQGLKPSMEFEFHSILKTFVLHTHSVYANIITCTSQCAEILAQLFNKDEYAIVPYVTPGFPIAAYILNHLDTTNLPPVIFLKNHGIIVHGDDFEKVIEKYREVEAKIKQHYQVAPMPDVALQPMPGRDDCFIIDSDGLAVYEIDLSTALDDLMNDVLIPDQSIFFRNKISAQNADAEIFLDAKNERIILKGSDKFINAARGMLQAVYFVKNNISRLGLNPDYIPENKIAEMHGLSTEKYRSAILKNK